MQKLLGAIAKKKRNVAEEIDLDQGTSSRDLHTKQNVIKMIHLVKFIHSKFNKIQVSP